MERTQLWAAPEAVEDDSRDYLQDPQLWLDRLPQPFRMIDDLLQELLERSWQSVEEREREIEKERATGRIPEIVSEGTVGGVHNVLAMKEGRDGRLVFVGCGDGVRVAVEEDEGPVCATHSRTESAVVSLAVERIEDVHIVAACTESGSVLLFASLLSGFKLIQLAEIAQQEEGRKAAAALLSTSCSHVVITTHNGAAECKLLCYQLPTTAWLEELATYRGEAAATGSEGEEGREPQAYSKPSQMFTIHPPKAPAPCAASSQHAALINAHREGVATGEHHMLTELYFKNRRRAFEAQRFGFTQEPPPQAPGQSVPVCHFVYFRNGIKQDEPCHLAVWWTLHAQLLLYSLSSKGSTPVLEQTLPQTSTISVTSISRDGRSLAVGLESGVVIVWDFKTNFCRGVHQVVRGPEIVTALMFYPKSEGVPLLAVGTDHGTVLLVKSGPSTTSLDQRASKQQGLGQSSFLSSKHDCPKVVEFSYCAALPQVVLSLHVDGTVVLWNTTALEPLCKLLPPSPLTSTPTLSAVSKSHVFITESSTHRRELEAKTPSAGLHYLNLSSVKHLQKYYVTGSSDTDSVKGPPTTAMDIVGNMLMESTVKLFAESELFETKRAARWTQFAEHLQAE